MKTKGGIYQILNTVNDKQYIGSAVNLQKRRKKHWNHLRRGVNSPYLQNAWNKYGESAFSFKVIEYVLNPERLIEQEQYYLDILKPEYNLSPTAGSNLGHKHTSEFCEKAKKNSIGNKNAQGENSSFAKLTKFKVIKIYSLLAEDKLSYREIANMFGITEETIWSIKTRRTWKHIKISKALTDKMSNKRSIFKLTESKIKEIRIMITNKRTLREIGKIFGVSYQTIWLIKEGHIWKHAKKDS